MGEGGTTDSVPVSVLQTIPLSKCAEGLSQAAQKAAKAGDDGLVALLCKAGACVTAYGAPNFEQRGLHQLFGSQGWDAQRCIGTLTAAADGLLARLAPSATQATPATAGPGQVTPIDVSSVVSWLLGGAGGSSSGRWEGSEAARRLVGMAFLNLAEKHGFKCMKMLDGTYPEKIGLLDKAVREGGELFEAVFSSKELMTQAFAWPPGNNRRESAVNALLERVSKWCSGVQEAGPTEREEMVLGVLLSGVLPQGGVVGLGPQSMRTHALEVLMSTAKGQDFAEGLGGKVGVNVWGMLSEGGGAARVCLAQYTHCRGDLERAQRNVGKILEQVSAQVFVDSCKERYGVAQTTPYEMQTKVSERERASWAGMVGAKMGSEDGSWDLLAQRARTRKITLNSRNERECGICAALVMLGFVEGGLSMAEGIGWNWKDSADDLKWLRARAKGSSTQDVRARASLYAKRIEPLVDAALLEESADKARTAAGSGELESLVLRKGFSL